MIDLIILEGSSDAVKGMRISELRNGLRGVSIEGKIVNMDRQMIVIDDESGRTFVRYWGNAPESVKIGSLVRIENCEVVNYSGIIQVKLGAKGKITLL